MEPVNVLSHATMLELQRMLRWWRQVPLGGTTGDFHEPQNMQERHVRYALTQRPEVSSTYPKSGNVMPIVLGERTYDETSLSQQDQVFKPYEPFDERNVFSQFGYIPEKTVIPVSLHNGQWFTEWNPGIVHIRTIAAIPAATVPSDTSNTTPGYGSCHLWEMQAESLGNPGTEAIAGTQVVDDQGDAIQVTVYNKSTTAIPATTHLMASYDTNRMHINVEPIEGNRFYGQFLFAIWQDCP